MSITPEISPRIIKSIASLYNDVNRIFLEYVDNAIDSADQNWLSKDSSTYTKPIEIKIEFLGTREKDFKVIILDNCFGVTNFNKLVKSIGSSDKKAQGFTNGQFGFGIYSFMAACSELEIISKEKGRDALRLNLNREQFDQDRQKDVQIPDPKVENKFIYESGTKIELSGFDKGLYRTTKPEDLKKDIERHFELILSRKNLKITIISNGAEEACTPFDYNSIKGEIYEDHITHFHTEGGRGNKKYEEVIELTSPTDVFIKMTEGVSLNKPPVFVSKGRRICEIKDVKSFKSKHKGDIWSHSNITGYIDVKDLLDPTIARTDFKNNKNSKALFAELNELEDLILEYVKRANTQTDEKHYQQLEDALNKALSKLAKLDAMNFRTSFLKGEDKNLIGGSLGMSFVEEDEGYDFSGDGGDGTGGLNDDAEDGISSIPEGESPGGASKGDQPKNKEDFADTEFTGKERKKSGFNIRISDTEPQVDAETEKALRSILSGHEIVVFKKHPDFQSRLQHTRQGESKISDRLLAYIAGEITIHYKDEFYNKHENGQPEYNKNMFISMAEFIYQLEEALTPLTGKNLSEFE